MFVYGISLVESGLSGILRSRFGCLGKKENPILGGILGLGGIVNVCLWAGNTLFGCISKSPWIYEDLWYTIGSLGEGVEWHFPFLVWVYCLAGEVNGSYGQDNR